MRALATFASLTAGLSIAASSALASPEEPVGALAKAPTAAPSTDRVIVQWAPNADRDDRLAARAEADVSFERSLGQPGLQLLEVDPGQTVGDAVASLRADDATRAVERDRLSFPQAVPNDTLFDELWGLSNPGGPIGVAGFPNPLAGADIRAVSAWDRTVGDPSTVVAIVDSGYRFNHPDLAPVTWANSDEDAGDGIDDDLNGRIDDIRGYDFVGQNADVPVGDNDPSDSDLLTGGHGVHVAGTVGASGGDSLGITGVAQNARIMPLRVCAHSPAASAVAPAQARASCPDSALIQAIDYAGDNGAAVANLSLGRAGSPSQLVIDAFARNPQTLYAISAGNDGADNDGGGAPPAGHHYPCDHNPATQSAVPGRIDNIVCVAATDQADRLAGFSDYGTVSVDLAAPGTDTLSSYPVSERFSETFAVDDFATRWTATGVSGGFARTSELPQTSFGISDSPGAAPAAGSVRESTLTTGVAIAAGTGTCRLSARRYLSRGGGTFSYSVLSNDAPVFTSVPASDTSGSAMAFFQTVPISGLAGTTVKVRFTYIAGVSPTSANGVWLDDVKLDCYEATNSSAATYAFLDGTSMAAPHVAGAAALLFSLQPSASVAQVRNALLQGATPIRSLLCHPVTGLDLRRTVTGGRLDVPRAMDVLSGLPPTSVQTPVCGQPPSPPQPGPSVPAVQPRPQTVGAVGGPARCHVPKLAKLSLRRAKALLGVSNCKLGKVTKPKRRKGQRKLPPLVVKSSKPKAGAELAAGSKVAVTLGPKPRPKKRKRR